jgi:hypothetical protein
MDDVLVAEHCLRLDVQDQRRQFYAAVTRDQRSCSYAGATSSRPEGISAGVNSLDLLRTSGRKSNSGKLPRWVITLSIRHRAPFGQPFN